MEVKANPNVLLTINNTDNKQLLLSTPGKNDAADGSAPNIKLNENEDKTVNLPAPTPSIGHPEQVSSSDKANQDDDHHVNEKSTDVNVDDKGGNGDDHNVGNDKDNEFEEGESDSLKLVESAAQAVEAMELVDA